MTRTMSRLALAVAFAMSLAVATHTAPAFAEWQEADVHVDDDGSTLIWMHEKETGKWALWVIKPDNTNEIYEGDEEGNPNPEDTATGKGSHSDKVDVAGLIKSGKATYKVHIAPADLAELVSHIKGALGNGGGLGPHYNPGDQDTDHGPGNAPSHSMQVKKTAAEIRQQIRVINEVARTLQGIATAMGTGEEGGSESPNGPNKHGHGGKSDDSGNYTEGQNKNVGKTEKSLLGAKPEVINPPHLNKVGKALNSGKARTSTTGKGTALSVTGPGLLDGGMGFNQNGPAATGSPGSATRPSMVWRGNGRCPRKIVRSNIRWARMACPPCVYRRRKFGRRCCGDGDGASPLWRKLMRPRCKS